VNTRTHWITALASVLSLVIGGATLQVVVTRNTAGRASSSANTSLPAVGEATLHASGFTAPAPAANQHAAGAQIVPTAKTPSATATQAETEGCTLGSLADSIGRLGKPKTSGCADPDGADLGDVCTKRWKLVGGGVYEEGAGNGIGVKSEELTLPGADATKALQHLRACTNLPAEVAALDLEALLRSAVASNTTTEREFELPVGGVGDHQRVGLRVHPTGVSVESEPYDFCNWELKLTPDAASILWGCSC
jgi:hypothetical protein